MHQHHPPERYMHDIPLILATSVQLSLSFTAVNPLMQQGSAALYFTVLLLTALRSASLLNIFRHFSYVLLQWQLDDVAIRCLRTHSAV